MAKVHDIRDTPHTNEVVFTDWQLLMFLEPFAILQALLGVSILVALTLGWVHLTSQTSVARSFHNSYSITVRLASVYGIAWLLICGVFGFGIYWLVAASLIVYGLSPLATLGDRSGFISAIATEFPGFVVAFVVFLPIYILKQFILGFPEHDLVVLSPPDGASIIPPRPDSAIPNLDQQLVNVASTLRPTGKIEFKGTRFDAISFDGTMIDAGQLVEVCARKDRMFVVRPIDSRD